MFNCAKKILPLLVFILLSGCEQNNDIALLSSYPVFGSCSIDMPKANETLISNQEFSVSGWAFDEKNKTIPDILTLYLINDSTSEIFTFPGKRGAKRPDVAAVFKLPKLVDSGFDALVPKNSLTPGAYRVVLLQASRGTGVISCNGLSHKLVIQ